MSPPGGQFAATVCCVSNQAHLLHEMAALADAHAAALAAPVRAFDIGGRAFDFDAHPEMMGVVNLSRDSWYRESVVPDADAAVRRGAVLAAQGAAIVDIGAESTLEHAARVSAEDQTAAVLPVVRGLHAQGILTSVETYSPEVARVVLAPVPRCSTSLGWSARTRSMRPPPNTMPRSSCASCRARTCVR